MPVTYPHVEETAKTALRTMLSPYFAGGTFTISGTTENFYKAQVEFDVNKVNENKNQSPMVVITGSRSEREDFKVNDPKQLKVFGGTQRQQMCTRTVYLSMPKTLPMQNPPYTSTKIRKAEWRDLDRLWAQLLLVCTGLRYEWGQHSIYHMDLESTSVQLPDADFFIVSGLMEFQLRYEYTK